MPSRTTPTSLVCSSRSCPMNSSSVCALPLLFASAISEPGNLHGERHEVAIARQTEVIQFARQREIRQRIAQHERLLQLVFFIGRVEFLEILIAEVAALVIELRLDVVVQS